VNAPKIFLVGPMGSGKTTVAAALAQRLGWPWVDLDQEIVAAAGRPIPAIFAEEGEAGFRDWEARVLAEVAARPRSLVVATGGGVVLREANRQCMREAGRLVYLRADVDTLLARTSGDTNRPLLQVADPRSQLAALQAQREPLYRQAHRTEETAGVAPATVADRLLAWVGQQWPGAASPGVEDRE